MLATLLCRLSLRESSFESLHPQNNGFTKEKRGDTFITISTITLRTLLPVSQGAPREKHPAEVCNDGDEHAVLYIARVVSVG